MHTDDQTEVPEGTDRPHGSCLPPLHGVPPFIRVAVGSPDVREHIPLLEEPPTRLAASPMHPPGSGAPELKGSRQLIREQLGRKQNWTENQGPERLKMPSPGLDQASAATCSAGLLQPACCPWRPSTRPPESALTKLSSPRMPTVG